MNFHHAAWHGNGSLIAGYEKGLAGLLGAVTSYVAILFLAGKAASLGGEHGPLEMLHGVFLILALAALCDAWRIGRGGARLASALLVVATAVGLCREVDLTGLGLTDPYRWLRLRGLMEEVTALAAAIALVIVWLRPWDVWDAAKLAIRRESWPLYAGLALLVIAEAIEFYWPELDGAHFWEELIELYGYSLLLMAALRQRELSWLSVRTSGARLPAAQTALSP